MEGSHNYLRLWTCDDPARPIGTLQRLVHHDAAKPRLELPIEVELLNVLVGLDERFRHRVFGRLKLQGDTERNSRGPDLMHTEQCVEATRITVPHGRDGSRLRLHAID